jgi:hypothetical protein
MSSTCRLPAFAATAGNPVVVPDRPHQGSRRTARRRIEELVMLIPSRLKNSLIPVKFPDLLNIFPANFRRELREK